MYYTLIGIRVIYIYKYISYCRNLNFQMFHWLVQDWNQNEI